MTAVAVLLVLLVAAFVQAWLPAVNILGMAKPPLVLGAVVYYALARGRFAMLWAALVGGIIQDSLDFMPLGCSALCFSLIGLAIQSARDLLFKESLLTASVLTAAGAALLTLVTRMFLAFGDFEAVPPAGGDAWIVWVKAGGAALLALAAAPPVFGAARGLDALIGATEASEA